MGMFLRPRWLLVHAVVAALALLFVSLGVWQLDRLAQRRAENGRITANLSHPVAGLAETLERFGDDPRRLAYRRVTARGTYRPADEVLLTPRSNGGRAGHHVVTPLLLADDGAVLVDRGWVPYEHDEPPVAAAAPPDGEVTVTGILVPTREAARFGSAEGDGELTFLSTVDVRRIQPQVDVPLHPVSVLLQQQRPQPSSLPVTAAPPEVSEGSHQSYALQWFAFATILLGGYPLLLRRSWRSARERGIRDAG